MQVDNQVLELLKEFLNQDSIKEDIEEGELLSVCDDWKQYLIHNYVETKNGDFYKLTNVTALVEIFLEADPDSLLECLNEYTIIAEHFFDSVEYPKPLVLPDGIKEIDDYAFSYAKIPEVVIPENVETIESSALYNYTGKVTYKGTKEQFSKIWATKWMRFKDLDMDRYIYHIDGPIHCKDGVIEKRGQI